MINIPPTYPTPLYVFSQVVSLPADTETVLDQHFIENAEKIIKELEDDEYGDEEYGDESYADEEYADEEYGDEEKEDEREIRALTRKNGWSFQPSPLVIPNSQDDPTLVTVILSLVGAMLVVTLAMVVRVVVTQMYNGGDNKTVNSEGGLLMEQHLTRTRLKEEKDRREYFGPEGLRRQSDRQENVYVSTSINV